MKPINVPLARTMLVKEQILSYDKQPAALTSPKLIAKMMTEAIELEASESFFAISIDTRRRPIQVVRVSTGSLTQAMAHPREVFRAAIIASAAGVVICHNHPSGDPRPSSEDHAMTTRLRECGELLNIPVLDHVIVTAEAERYFSYSEQGWPRA